MLETRNTSNLAQFVFISADNSGAECKAACLLCAVLVDCKSEIQLVSTLECTVCLAPWYIFVVFLVSTTVET